MVSVSVRKMCLKFFWSSLSDFERETKMSVGVITVGILYADFLEDNENSIL